MCILTTLGAARHEEVQRQQVSDGGWIQILVSPDLIGEVVSVLLASFESPSLYQGEQNSKLDLTVGFRGFFV